MRSRLIVLLAALFLLPLGMMGESLEESGEGRGEREMSAQPAARGLARNAASSPATAAPSPADTARLLREAMADDFIRASLLVVDPGSDIYTVFGHAALRMECPSRGLDFCFTFEMDMDAGSLLRFVRHKAKAGFAAAPTEVFLRQYREAHRGVTAYELKLTPREKQELWRNLDREVAAGATWDYDYPVVNCASMCVYVVEKSLQGGAPHYQMRPPLSQGSYAALVGGLLPENTWQRLFWQAVVVAAGKDSPQFTDKLSPAMLAEVWQHARVNQPQGRTVTLLSRHGETLVPPGPPMAHGWFTPRMAAALLVMVMVVVAVLVVRRRRARRALPKP